MVVIIGYIIAIYFIIKSRYYDILCCVNRKNKNKIKLEC